jgi:hypothetical protein
MQLDILRRIDMSDILWNDDHECSEFVEVPAWINQEITPYDVAAILQGGCASGAYMPAVTYYQAVATMAEHGNDVLDFIADMGWDIDFDVAEDSWSGFACKVLSIAVETWASSVEELLTDALQEIADAE